MKTLMFVLFACVTTASVKADERCEPDIPSRPLPTLPITDHSSRTFNVKCPEGEFSSLGKCLPCEAGTFRTKAMAALDYPTCLACQEADTSLGEVVMTSCNRTRDSQIMCENIYYRYETPRNRVFRNVKSVPFVDWVQSCSATN
ncbi:hypothetical protein Bpfe_030423 [Biomphalaria pfeifferi]|uniref:Tyrosine-protein kinase ephrin type A/B receptor-like domain-containing protein n=1 Tax=Biomphalaria pfeifferi TaxID=112525 RepID=A0AAD8ARB0_BIOPF|nr:hypothetical protein Bpfe_030423 [Biomphalaria pfeifferi]